MSTVALEKNRELLFQSATCLQTVTSLGVFSLAFREHDLLKIANFNLQQEARFLLWKKISSPGERRKWSLGLAEN